MLDVSFLSLLLFRLVLLFKFMIGGDVVFVIEVFGNRFDASFGIENRLPTDETADASFKRLELLLLLLIRDCCCCCCCCI